MKHWEAHRDTHTHRCASQWQDGHVRRCVYFWVRSRDGLHYSIDIYHLPAAEKLPAHLERTEARPGHWKHISIHRRRATV